MAAILVANGQGESAVSSPSKSAVTAGVVELSNNDCNHSIALVIKHFYYSRRQTLLELIGSGTGIAKSKFR